MLKACRCYGLTLAEVDLTRRTAPPRMPVPAPMKGSVHENVVFSQAAVGFLAWQPWRNKHGKASPLAWFALRGARGKSEAGPSCTQPLTSKLWFYGGR